MIAGQWLIVAAVLGLAFGAVFSFAITTHLILGREQRHDAAVSDLDGMKPSVGRIVHYVSAGHSLGTYASTCRAAIVTDVKSETEIACAVFSGKGMWFYEAVTLDEGKAGGSWHWPELTEAPTSSILKASPDQEAPKKTPKKAG